MRSSRPAPIGAFGRRVALYGGSFDPVHLGHAHVARLAAEHFALDQIVFVPAAASPHKQGWKLAAAGDRVAMLDLALAREPRWSVWTCELDRPGPSYSIDTLRSAPRALALPDDVELHWVLGWDNLRGFERWREARELVRLAQPIVVWRGADDEAALATVLGELGAELGARLERGLVRAPPAPISATDVRARIARGDWPRESLEPTVLEYIRARGIYSSVSTP